MILEDERLKGFLVKIKKSINKSGICLNKSVKKYMLIRIRITFC